MKNQTQIDRYKKLIVFLNNNYKEDLTTKQIESICFYSYRNINRIFSALHNESIGQYIKRLRIEKAAEYIKFSNSAIAKIAMEVGFNDVSIFNKAFKNRFGISPTAYRLKNQKTEAKLNGFSGDVLLKTQEALDFDIVNLPELRILYLTYLGSYQNAADIEAVWNELFAYSIKNNLINSRTVYIGELLDDDEITIDGNCRYNACITIPKSLNLEPKKLFAIKTIQPQKYARFIFTGSQEKSIEFYNSIFSSWISTIDLELADESILEFYPDSATKNQITEIHVPVL